MQRASPRLYCGGDRDTRPQAELRRGGALLLPGPLPDLRAEEEDLVKKMLERRKPIL
jgi:hypothetical protein